MNAKKLIDGMINAAATGMQSGCILARVHGDPVALYAFHRDGDPTHVINVHEDVVTVMEKRGVIEVADNEPCPHCGHTGTIWEFTKRGKRYGRFLARDFARRSGRELTIVAFITTALLSSGGPQALFEFTLSALAHGPWTEDEDVGDALEKMLTDFANATNAELQIFKTEIKPPSHGDPRDN